jgi:hypothetical protein
LALAATLLILVPGLVAVKVLGQAQESAVVYLQGLLALLGKVFLPLVPLGKTLTLARLVA